MASKFGTRYAVVASTVALVLALSGTAYAVATIDSSDIVNDSVQGVDVHDGTIRSVDVGNGSLQRADFAAGQVSPRLFAVVNGDGTLFASAGVTATTHPGNGSYTITFNRQIGGCAWVGTPNARNAGVASTDNRIITLNGSPVTNVINVATGLLGNPINMPFSVAVIC